MPFFDRLGRAFVEIVIAAAVLAGSVVIGHELKEWREWFWSPTTVRPWAPTPKPPAPTEFVHPR